MNCNWVVGFGALLARYLCCNDRINVLSNMQNRPSITYNRYIMGDNSEELMNLARSQQSFETTVCEVKVKSRTELHGESSKTLGVQGYSRTGL